MSGGKKVKEEDIAKSPPKPREARDVNNVRVALAPWFLSKLKEAKEIEFSDFIIPEANSYSSEVILFGAKWRTGDGENSEKFVIRVPPQETALFWKPDFHRDYKIAEALYQTKSAPVPKTYWYESNPEILGAPFCVTAQAEGRAAQDNPPYNIAGWLADATAEVRDSVWWSGVEAMAKLNSLDWEAAGLGFLRRSSGPKGELEKEIDYYADYYDWACEGHRLDFIDKAGQWLRANMPDVGSLCFCWGDARMGNILYHNNHCNACLDWEMASLGEPEKDLAYWIAFDRFNREGVGAPAREGWPSYEETIAWYERRLGRPMRNLHYYEIFAMYRTSVILSRLANLWAMMAPGNDPGMILNNHYILDSLRSAMNG